MLRRIRDGHELVGAGIINRAIPCALQREAMLCRPGIHNPH